MHDLEKDKLPEKDKAKEWRLFIEKFAGCLADDPIELSATAANDVTKPYSSHKKLRNKTKLSSYNSIKRGDQGQFEVRERFE